MHCRVLLLITAISACGGDDGAGRTLVPIEGLEGMAVNDLVVHANDDLTMLRNASQRIPMRWNGTTVVQITTTLTDRNRQIWTPDSATVYMFSNSSIHRIDGTTTVQAGVDGSFTNVVIDSTNTFYDFGAGAKRLPPGASAWETLTTDPATLYVLDWQHAADGGLYLWAGDGTNLESQDLFHVDAGGTSVVKLAECERAEFAFCGAGMWFPRGRVGQPMVLAGPRLYRIEGTSIVEVARLPTYAEYVHDFVRGADGKLYVVSALNNTPSEDVFVFRLDGAAWKQVMQLPGPGGIAVDSAGTIYAALHLIGANGGLWHTE